MIRASPKLRVTFDVELCPHDPDNPADREFLDYAMQDHLQSAIIATVHRMKMELQRLDIAAMSYVPHPDPSQPGAHARLGIGSVVVHHVKLLHDHASPTTTTRTTTRTTNTTGDRP